MINICNDYNNNKVVSVSENRRKFIIKNSSYLYINRVKVDDCYIKNGERCDYLFEIIKNDNINIIFYLELKGKEIEKAIKQLESTIRYCKNIHNNRNIKKESHIVSSRVPSSGTSLQNLKKKFKKDNGMLLFVKNNIQEVTI